MLLTIIALLFQALPGPDPAQMEKAPDLGYKPIPHGMKLPEGVTMGAPSGVVMTPDQHVLVFNRGPFPLLEFKTDGTFVRSLGEGRYVRPHGLRLDRQGNVWTADVNGHTVTKLSPKGDVLMTLGVKGQAGDWNDAANSKLLNEPVDLAFSAADEIFVVQGHGRAESRVLKFDKTGQLLHSWGGKGTGPGQFDLAHSIVIDRKGLLYVADRQNRRVQIFDGNGKYIKEWKYAGLPCGLLIGPNDQLYMVSGYAGQILRLDENGKAVGMTGQPGKGLGEFGEAHYLAIASNGDIFVADTIKPDLHRFVKK
jgi:DNA-binding beta-propeller fold protein YncE